MFLFQEQFLDISLCKNYNILKGKYRNIWNNLRLKEGFFYNRTLITFIFFLCPCFCCSLHFQFNDSNLRQAKRGWREELECLQCHQTLLVFPRFSPTFPPFSKDVDRWCCCCCFVATVIWHLPLENVFKIKTTGGESGVGFSCRLMAVMKALD